MYLKILLEEFILNFSHFKGQNNHFIDYNIYENAIRNTKECTFQLDCYE